MKANKNKVLVIEDNPADTLGLGEMLRQTDDLSFEIALAAPIAAPVTQLTVESSDLVLLNLSLPARQGAEAVRRLREQSPLVPIIAVTANEDGQGMVELFAAGADDCLVAREIDGRGLTWAMRNVMRRKQFGNDRGGYQHQSALNSIATAVSQSLQLEEILEIAVAKVVEVTGCEMAHIRLRNPVTKEVRLAAHRGLPSEYVDALLERSNATGKLEHVLSSGEVLVGQGSIPIARDGEFVKGEERPTVWIPLKAKGRVVGVLNVATRRRESFTEREVELLKAIGHVIGVGLENARLFTETRRQLTRVDALREISVAAATSLNLSRVLQILLERIAAILPYSAVALRVLDHASGELRPAASWKIDKEEWQARKQRAVGPGLSAIVFQSKRPLAIRRFLSDPRVRRPEIFRKQGLVSYLGLPMIANGEAIGVLSIYTKFEHEFPEEEIRFLSALANQAGMAIHNSQLYEQLSSQAAELARSNKVKDEFLNVMSHEFRTPLNVILGYCGLMQNHTLGGLTAGQEQALEKITGRSKELLAMLAAILEVTRLETDQVSLSPEHFDLSEFFGDFKSAHDMRLAKDVILEWRGPDSEVSLNTDRRKLQLIIEHLLANAIQFTETGKVTVAMSQGANEHFITLSVADTGVGIPRDAHESIFDKFTQLDGSATRAHEGIGLGLFLVRRFVDLLGGEVTLESEVGVGSTFKVSLPTDVDSLSSTEDR